MDSDILFEFAASRITSASEKQFGEDTFSVAAHVPGFSAVSIIGQLCATLGKENVQKAVDLFAEDEEL